jgi:hypothetical protein
MIRMAQNTDIAMAGSSLGTKTLQRMLGVCRITSQSLVNLLVHNNKDLNTGFGATFQDVIQTPFLVLHGRATHKQFRREPPIGNVDGLGGLV